MLDYVINNRLDYNRKVPLRLLHCSVNLIVINYYYYAMITITIHSWYYRRMSHANRGNFWSATRANELWIASNSVRRFLIN